MLALANKNKLEGTELTVFYKEKFRNRMEPDESTMNVIVGRAARFGNHFGFGRYPQCALTGEDRPFSKSLTDLTGMERTLGSGSRTADMRNLSTKGFSNVQFPWTENKVVKEAGRRVTHLLLLHAWRCQRLGAQRSQTLISALNNQVKNLNMQLHVVRQLLENEKTRRDLAVQKMYSEKVQSERERNMILKEKGTLECKVKELLEFKVECKNQKNNFKAAKMEAESWEIRYNQEKKNSETLKDQYLILVQKTQEKEKEIAHQARSLSDLHLRKAEVEEELDANLSLFNDTIEQLNSVQGKLKLSEELAKQQERFLMEKNEEINQLRAQIALMEEKLQEQDEKNGELGKLISDKTKELVLLHDKLGELTKSQRFWGNRVIQMATICTRIPIVCFYTVVTLLLPQPSYRSI